AVLRPAGPLRAPPARRRPGPPPAADRERRPAAPLQPGRPRAVPLCRRPAPPARHAPGYRHRSRDAGLRRAPGARRDPRPVLLRRRPRARLLRVPHRPLAVRGERPRAVAVRGPVRGVRLPPGPQFGMRSLITLCALTSLCSVAAACPVYFTPQLGTVVDAEEATVVIEGRGVEGFASMGPVLAS